MPAPQRITVPIIGQTARDKNFLVNNQATINLMHSIKSVGAKAPVTLESICGLIDRGALGNGPCRTSQMVNSDIRSGIGELYGAYGTKLMAQTLDNGNIEIGDLDNNPGRVVIARGRTHIMMVDGVSGYTYDGTTFAKITDLDFPGVSDPGRPSHCVYIDGFFLVNDQLTDNYFISPKEDPTSWNALEFDAAAVSPDRGLAMVATTSRIWIIGDETAQPFFNSENPIFPYAVSLSGVQEVGILAPYSLAESDDGIFFLATTPEGGRFIYRIQGESGQVITGEEQEAFLDTVIDPTDAYAFVYKQAGKSFYVLQLSATEGDDARTSATLVYNIRANKWETRELIDGSAWRVGGHGILGGRNIGGSRIQNRQVELDLSTYTDTGQDMIRTRRSQVIHAGGNILDWHELIIDVETGTGLQAGTTSQKNPRMRIRYFDYDRDGRRFESDYFFEELGPIGERGRRIILRNLGQGPAREWELSCAAPIPWSIVKMEARVTVLED